ncbi:DUF1003 domain-containing protein [Candidatus Phyllobacterium onerii]|uniref:DUF1003 domain-containing protein n=1 Tax=Candidatus Phyllobacterium onerii TaxID=3020828 RepID=UPI00232E1E27|nr:DUF1003 domain-containing protein [Phyllobacterium sp. IY22]
MSSTSGNSAHEGGETNVIDRNIDELLKRRAEEDRGLTLQDRISDTITRFAGSMAFVYIHLGIFGMWVVINEGWLELMPPWDPSLVILAMVASVEAIFISTFVLISQNKMAVRAEKRAELNLHISLLAEHETTKLIALIAAIADHLGISTELADEEIKELKESVSPETVLKKMERRPSWI